MPITAERMRALIEEATELELYASRAVQAFRAAKGLPPAEGMALMEQFFVTMPSPPVHHLWVERRHFTANARRMEAERERQRLRRSRAGVPTAPTGPKELGGLPPGGEFEEFLRWNEGEAEPQGTPTIEELFSQEGKT